jgi:hypothetical protein
MANGVYYVVKVNDLYLYSICRGFGLDEVVSFSENPHVKVILTHEDIEFIRANFPNAKIYKLETTFKEIVF